ncbi:hypothetical protein N665_0018s0033 [Sinapis alba]|nr:hypothetical protein N665_0018s0033 [Sinapis alba]
MDTSELTNQPEETPPDWRILFILYFSNGSLSEDNWEARRLKTKSSNYVVLLMCLGKEEAALAMAETHEGTAGNHSGGRALSLKEKNIGFYWTTMVAIAKCTLRLPENANTS